MYEYDEKAFLVLDITSHSMHRYTNYLSPSKKLTLQSLDYVLTQPRMPRAGGELIRVTVWCLVCPTRTVWIA